MRAYPRSGPVNTTVSLVTIPRDHATLEDLARSRNLSLRQQTRIILKQGNSESIVYPRASYYQVSLSRIRISKVCNFTRRIRYLYRSYLTIDSLLIIIGISYLLYTFFSVVVFLPSYFSYRTFINPRSHIDTTCLIFSEI